MPEGPFGFPRPATFGPFSRETEQELRDSWADCEEKARDSTDVEICRVIKREAIALLEDQSVRPKCQTLEEINQGLCSHISQTVMGEFDDPRIKEIETGGMNWLHRVIEYRGRYFDAEVPSGVDDPSLIPLHQRVNRAIDDDDLRVIQSSAEYEGEMYP